MKCSTATWTIALAAAAVLALPGAARTQTSAAGPPSADSATPTTSPTDPTPTPAGTSPTATPQTPAPEPADASGSPARGAQSEQKQGANTARQHLTAARNALSELTQLPAAAQLTGETRNQVSQVISNFNELITTTTNWRAPHAKVEANLLALLGPDEDAALEAAPAEPDAPVAVGTTGAADLDPEIRGKLVEFRNHLNEFERAVSGTSDVATRASETDPTAASGSTSTGAEQTTPGTLPADSTAGQQTTEGRQPQTADASADAPEGDAMRHIEAIEALLNGQPESAAGAPVGTTGAQQPGSGNLDAAKVELIRTHLNELRRILEERR